jgi:hypothetical protein
LKPAKAIEIALYRYRSMSSLISRLHQAQTELAERRADPWQKKLQGALGATEAISTHALLDLLRVPATTGNARRLAEAMRSLGYIPLKSRRLMPGGLRDTVIRGWARPFRESDHRRRLLEGAKVSNSHINTPTAVGSA